MRAPRLPPRVVRALAGSGGAGGRRSHRACTAYQIHEFDPWFNYRATEYLDQHGLAKFFKWYDYMAWYPLGRPVGTTIYPGMQMTSVFLKNTLNSYGIPISLNDVCCYVPAWGGVTATILLGMIVWETTGNANAATMATGIMAIIPAHIMRSVGGGYDNEVNVHPCLASHPSTPPLSPPHRQPGPGKCSRQSAPMHGRIAARSVPPAPGADPSLLLSCACVPRSPSQ
jgi:hypothetical protein